MQALTIMQSITSHCHIWIICFSESLDDELICKRQFDTHR
mgnify:CR=1 FL=1